MTLNLVYLDLLIFAKRSKRTSTTILTRKLIFNNTLHLIDSVFIITKLMLNTTESVSFETLGKFLDTCAEMVRSEQGVKYKNAIYLSHYK